MSALPHCTGTCHGGRARCDCPTGQTELACDIAPDDKRVIQPPVPKPEPNWRARAAAWALAITAAMYVALALLLRAAGARSL